MVKLQRKGYWQNLSTGEWWYQPTPEKKKHRAEIKICAWCEEHFIGRSRTDGRNKGTFCSRLCSGRGTARRGEDHYKWKGGRHPDKDGYIKIFTGHGKRPKLEHRIVMSEYLGRPLTKNETVHHINGIKDDNRLENLQLRIKNHGPGQHYVCMECGSDKLEAKEI